MIDEDVIKRFRERFKIDGYILGNLKYPDGSRSILSSESIESFLLSEIQKAKEEERKEIYNKLVQINNDNDNLLGFEVEVKELMNSLKELKSIV